MCRGRGVKNSQGRKINTVGVVLKASAIWNESDDNITIIEGDNDLIEQWHNLIIYLIIQIL